MRNRNPQHDAMSPTSALTKAGLAALRAARISDAVITSAIPGMRLVRQING
jgi:hypothetical protein